VCVCACVCVCVCVCVLAALLLHPLLIMAVLSLLVVTNTQSELSQEGRG